VALVVLSASRRFRSPAVAQGIAGGLLFSIGDISTKLATEGGARTAFIATLILGYLLGTSLIQIGYQHGNALTVAGLATLLTNAVPIVFGTVVLREPVPPGVWGSLRILAYIAVSAGAILLARPDIPPGEKTATAPSAHG
jgi:drug/metabolite transporter (DMT)-like permease